MFFVCELKKLRRLRSELLAQYRCEKILANLPGQLEPRIEACEELAALKIAEENLAAQKKIDADDKKKQLRRATWIAGIISLVVSVIVTLLLSLTTIPAVLTVVGATFVLTLIARLIAKAKIKKRPAKNAEEIAKCEDDYAIALVDFEAAKIIIEDQLQVEIAYYQNVLNVLNAMIELNSVVPESDKNYNTVCQIIWCFEHKHAYCVKEARTWIECANHNKRVRQKLAECGSLPQEDEPVNLEEVEAEA